MQIKQLGIVIYGYATHIKDEIAQLSHHYNVQIVPPQDSRAKVITRFRDIAAKGTFQVMLFVCPINPAPYNAEIFEPFLPSLKLVAGLGCGYDHVDISYLTAHHVVFANTPVAVSEPTATTAVQLILQAVRASSQAEAVVRRGEWRLGLETTPDIRDLTVGIIGMGTIGKLTQKKLDALGFQTIYHNRRQLPPSEEGTSRYVSFDELIETADVISVHTPLTNETYHMLSDAEFARMKDGVFIVNTGRGSVIDEKALVRAMESNKVCRVGLDVFECEPEIEPYLRKSERASLLPHWATHTIRTQRDVEREMLANFLNWMKTGRPNTPVNEPSARKGDFRGW